MPWLSGLTKKYRKAEQIAAEKFTGAQSKTEIDHDFQAMEKRTNLFEKMLNDVISKTQDFLYPNPAVRVKMTVSKMAGKEEEFTCPELPLGNAMCDHGQNILDIEMGNAHAEALIEVGETFKQMSELKAGLESSIKQDFLAPLHQTQSNELKNVLFYLKKVQSRKLDLDYNKRRGKDDADVEIAQVKFAESLKHAQVGMQNLLEDGQVEYIAQLTKLTEYLLDYHQECSSILMKLTDALQEIQEEAVQKGSNSKPSNESQSIDDHDSDSESKWNDADSFDDDDDGVLCTGFILSKSETVEGPKIEEPKNQEPLDPEVPKNEELNNTDPEVPMPIPMPRRSLTLISESETPIEVSNAALKYSEDSELSQTKEVEAQSNGKEQQDKEC